MEPSKMQYIEKNLPALVKLINCTPGLKVALKSAGLITDEEEEYLTHTGKNDGKIAENNALLKLLKTRRHSYEALLNALLEEEQMKALEILVAEDSYKESVCIKNTQLLQNFFQIRTERHGITSTLRDTFPLLTDKEAIAIMNDDTCHEAMKSLRCAETELQINGRVPPSRSLYLPRSISNRLVVDPAVFRLNCHDIFVFKNVKRHELVELVSPFYICSSSGQLDGITCRHIYLEDDEDWDELVDITKNPLHLIMRDNASFILQRSTATTPLIREYCSHPTGEREAYISEEKFCQVLQSENTKYGVCICDTPGMGKTWLLENIARQFQSTALDQIGIFVSANSLSKHLDRDFQLKSDAYRLRVVLDLGCASKLVASLLYHLAATCRNSVYIFVDGLDEVPQNEFESIRRFLKALNQSWKNVKLCLSARPHLRTELEELLGVIAYDILPFSRKEQCDTLVKHWTSIYPDAQQNKLQEFAENCIKACNKLQNNAKADILGIPLKCYIVATIYESTAVKVSLPYRKKSFPMTPDKTLQSICDLYEEYISYSFRKLTHKFGCTVSFDKSQLLSYHTCKALELLVPEIAVECRHTFSLELVSTEYILCMGILCSDTTVKDSTNFSFIHRSFAEYFVAKYFSQYWNNVFQSEQRVQAVDSCFFNVILLLRYKELYRNTEEYGSKLNCGIQIFTFEKEAVMWFLDMLLNSESPKWDGAHLFMLFKNNFFQLVISCIRINYINILSFLLKIVVDATPLNKLHERFLCPRKHFVIKNISMKELIRFKLWKLSLRQDCSVKFILRNIATYGTPEAAHQIFSIFGTSNRNYLFEICHQWPVSLLSPLEWAIYRNHLDMTAFFLDKTQLKGRGLLKHCLRKIFNEETETVTRYKICSLLIDFEPSLLEELSFENSTGGDLIPTNIDVMKFISSNHDFSWTLLAHTDKQKLMEHVMIKFVDELFFDMFILLFVKDAKASKQKDNESVLESYEKPGQDFTGLKTSLKYFQDTCDMTEAKLVFEDIKEPIIQYLFVGMNSVESLLILLELGIQVCKTDGYGRNSLHYASESGRVNIMGCLLSLGLDINLRDAYGDTPLLMMTTKNLLDTTKFLEQNGADIHAKNRMNQNVVHRVFMRMTERNSAHLDLCVAWSKLMIDHGCKKHFIMKDTTGQTPLDCLAPLVSKQFVKEILQLVEFSEGK